MLRLNPSIVNLSDWRTSFPSVLEARLISVISQYYWSTLQFIIDLRGSASFDDGLGTNILNVEPLIVY